MKLSRNTIQKYLKQGKELRWCDYTSEKANNINIEKFSKKYGGKLKKKIICLNNNKIFNSLNAGAKYCNLKCGTTISLCCKGKCKYAGKDPITKEELHWMYYEDYLKIDNENKNKIINE